MKGPTNTSLSESAPLGIGCYTVPEAGRLLRVAPRNINRWLGGYAYVSKGVTIEMPPLWEPQLPSFGGRIELSFRDLIELRFVNAFLAAGVGLKAIRHCIAYARECVADDHPFSTRRFQTDGRTIFLDSLHRSGETELFDLRDRQYVFKDVIARTFKDLDISEGAVASWRPFAGRKSIIIDPTRAFGQPIAAAQGVPTVVLAEAVQAEGSAQRVAFLYEVPLRIVQDAVQFEASLQAA